MSLQVFNDHNNEGLTEMSNDKPRNILQVDNTLPASLIAGTRLKYTIITLFTVLYQVPWNTLYEWSWYRAFVDFMATIYPTIASIPESPSQFPTYSMAMLAFANAIGPFCVIFYLFYGVIHVESIDLTIIDNLRKKTKLRLAIMAPLFVIFFANAPFYWNGHSFHLPTLFYQSKAAFLIMTIIVWIVNSMSMFALSAIYTSMIFLWRRR